MTAYPNSFCKVSPRRVPLGTCTGPPGCKEDGGLSRAWVRGMEARCTVPQRSVHYSNVRYSTTFYAVRHRTVVRHRGRALSTPSKAKQKSRRLSPNRGSTQPHSAACRRRGSFFLHGVQQVYCTALPCPVRGPLHYGTVRYPTVRTVPHGKAQVRGRPSCTHALSDSAPTPLPPEHDFQTCPPSLHVSTLVTRAGPLLDE